ncbi:hypothetical protein Psuf_065990 [Phytohabitans suffuscus]|uniref:PASTA domain-containing protein n=1 Tax=Phytohabitans suffuscus TaxID=624315 RepID=A0A6F8YTA4_9ACTN|nr:hypothetical protein [Phytohabitans suffuscus]BCB89286.1 hypothetical protein Psuf_065990 [Phytohabitans suffuscus]
MRKLVAAVAAGILLAATGPPTTARAIDHSKGHPGFCENGDGVTVVIDFQQLGGTTIVRCNPQTGRGTGLDALKGAGFQIAGVQRWGEAFICRVENRPSAVEVVPVKGTRGTRRRASTPLPRRRTGRTGTPATTAPGPTASGESRTATSSRAASRAGRFR